jgi:hypothetical protein
MFAATFMVPSIPAASSSAEIANAGPDKNFAFASGALCAHPGILNINKTNVQFKYFISPRGNVMYSPSSRPSEMALFPVFSPSGKAMLFRSDQNAFAATPPPTATLSRYRWSSAAHHPSNAQPTASHSKIGNPQQPKPNPHEPDSYEYIPSSVERYLHRRFRASPSDDAKPNVCDSVRVFPRGASLTSFQNCFRLNIE